MIVGNLKSRGYKSFLSKIRKFADNKYAVGESKFEITSSGKMAGFFISLEDSPFPSTGFFLSCGWGQ